jgi:hypothetical protein
MLPYRPVSEEEWSWPAGDADVAALLEQFQIGRFADLPPDAFADLYLVLKDVRRMALIVADRGREFEEELVDELYQLIRSQEASDQDEEMFLDVADPDAPEEPESS